MIAPGYYWIRWPRTDEWRVWRVHAGRVFTLGGRIFRVDDLLAEIELARADLGPRIEPPSTTVGPDL